MGEDEGAASAVDLAWGEGSVAGLVFGMCSRLGMDGLVVGFAFYGWFEGGI